MKQKRSGHLLSYLNVDSLSYLDKLSEDKNSASAECKAGKQWRSSLNLGEEVAYQHYEVQLHSKAHPHHELSKSAEKLDQSTSTEALSLKLDQTLDYYETRGHLYASLGVINKQTIVYQRERFLEPLGWKDSDLETKTPEQFRMYGSHISDVISTFEAMYVSTLGVDLTGIDTKERLWIRQALFEKTHQDSISDVRKKKAYKTLLRVEGLERYLNQSYTGQKRFSIEGSESVILWISELIEKLSAEEFKSVVIGMAHRGRLNLLVNIMGMPYAELSSLFEQTVDQVISGDVKYHMGYSGYLSTESGKIHASLMYNPSHLEAINAVTMGAVRARQDLCQSKSPNLTQTVKRNQESIALLIHGDAAISGQGVVAECLNMSYTQAYQIGGSIHVVINNQIGFTTEPQDSRSSQYCTDIAKSIHGLCIHVNAYDIETLLWTAVLAVDYRQKFEKDFFLDLIGYRLHGHNESDDATLANPILYKEIAKKESIPSTYAKKLIDQGVISSHQLNVDRQSITDRLKKGDRLADKLEERSWQYKHWLRYSKKPWWTQALTSIDEEALKTIAQALVSLPATLKLGKQQQRMHDQRVLMYKGELDMDWGAAENLAYASLVGAGYSVRLCGQDVIRGTFSHRHAGYFDINSGDVYWPYKQFESSTAVFNCYNSTLSEYAAMGFEYGYAETNADVLVIWEAQFGDFANNAQVIIDQFIASAWQKWKRHCGLVLFLPHGSEGQGPEHSSARLERFMQLAAQDNFQIVVPTTPAQHFHCLRRQIIRPYRSPLVVMTPKSLLRSKQARSSFKACSQGEFELVISHDLGQSRERVQTLVLCAGKIIYDIKECLANLTDQTTACMTIEQLYPFPKDYLKKTFKRFPQVKKVIWCQEEPRNQGAWYAIRHRIEGILDDDQMIKCIARPSMAAPAEGGYQAFQQAQNQLLSDLCDELNPSQGENR